MQPPEKYLKKHEVAQLLNKSVRTVEHWMRDGILPYFKLGRTVRFLWSDVKAQPGCEIPGGSAAVNVKSRP